MPLSIHSWHTHYRLAGPTTHAAAHRLDALRPAVAEACDATLARVLGSDPTVYVFRRIRTEWAVNHAKNLPSISSQKWGERLARSIVRTLADSHGSDEVVQYASDAEYTAACLVALVRGTARGDWRFATFRSAFRSTTEESIANVLLPRREQLPEILRSLEREGQATVVLASLAPDVAAELWSDPSASPAGPEGERPLFVAAAKLMEEIGWPSRGASEAEFRAFADTAPPPSDWADRASLADGVARCVRFLLGERTPIQNDQLAVAVATFDWLDTTRLTNQLRAIANRVEVVAISSVVRPPSAMRMAVQHSIAERTAWPDPLHRSNPANALAVYSTVTAQHPEWANVSTLKIVIDAEVKRAMPHATHRAEDRAWFDSPIAGIAVLWRSVGDLRLLAACRQFEFPVKDSAVAFSTLMMSVALRWGGLAPGAVVDGLVSELAGCDRPIPVAELRERWRTVPVEAHQRFREGLIRMAAAHRLFSASPRFAIGTSEGEGIFIGGDADARVWPFGSLGDATDAREHWRERFSQAVGECPPETDNTTDASLLANIYRAGRLGLPETDLTTLLVADLLLRSWARWLRKFERASSTYLLQQAVRRVGRYARTGDGWTVELPPLPLDPVLKLAGYFDPLERLGLSHDRRLRFVAGGL